MATYESTQVSTEMLNTAFCDRVMSGQIKEAEENGSLYIREKLYETGILRRLFDYRTVTSDELDPNLDDDNPAIRCEIEPYASKATFVPWRGTGERRYFYGRRFLVPFGKIESERISKSAFELMTIRMPIQEWLKENQVKQVQEEEDKLFMSTISSIVSESAEEAEEDSSVISQLYSWDSSSESIKDAFIEGRKILTRLRLPIGKVMMHANTYADLLKLKTDEIGHVIQEEHYRRGLEGEDSFLGTPVVTTIKDNLVKEGEMYFFAPQDYFCKFFFLKDATLFLKTEADMIHFHTYEAPGFGIGNTKGVVRVALKELLESEESSDSEDTTTEESTESEE